MCVSMAPAEFNGAITFGGEVTPELHLLGYQNSSQSFVGPNCMLLHVPTRRLTARDLVPTWDAPSFMKDMGETIHTLAPQSRGLSMGGQFRSAPIVVQYGSYEIVLASSAGDIPSALAQVSAAKRPVINTELLNWYDRNFDGYSFILACFNNADEKANHPILVKYQPTDPTHLFVPGLESHDGRPPIIGGREHPRDFKVIFGSRLATPNASLNSVRYTDELGALATLLPQRVVGFRDEGQGANADYSVKVDDVRSGMDYYELFMTMQAHTRGARLW